MIPGIIIISILLIGNGLVGLYAIKRHYDIKESELSVKKSIQYLNIEITDDKFKLLDKLIEREFDDFIKLHPDKFDDSGNSYINEEEYKKFLKDITQRIYKQITPALKANISLVYNFNTKDEQLTLILEKVGILLAIYRAKINTAVVNDTDNEKSTTNIF